MDERSDGRGRARGWDSTAEDAAIVAAALRGEPPSPEEWQEIASSLGVRIVRRELGGPRAVLGGGLLFLAP